MSRNVKESVAAAFADLPLPDEVTDSHGPEADEETAAFQGKDWRELDADFLKSSADALFFFTPAAFQYYLPAFLTRSFETDGANEIYTTTLLMLLEPTDDPKSDAFRRNRWGRLDPPQVEALQQWLAWLRTRATPRGVFEREVNESIQTVNDRHWWA